MRNVFILTLIAVIFFMALRTSMAGMLSYWWFAYFRPQDWIWLDVSKFRLPLVAALLFVIPSLLRGVFPEIKDKLAIFMLLFLGTGILSKVANGCSDIFQVINPMQQLVVMFICVFMTIRVVDSKLRLFYLIAVIGLSLSFYGSKAGFYSLLGGGASTYGVSNLTGLFKGSNAFAMGSAIYLFFVVFLMQQLTNKKPLKDFPIWFTRFPKLVKYAFYIAVLGNLLNIMSLSSRGSSLAVGVGLFLFYLLNSNRVKKLFIWSPFLIISLIFVPIPENYKERMVSIFAGSESRDGSAASRPHFWGIANEMVKDHPAGVGPGCYREYYNGYDHSNGQYGLNRVVHSTHFQILSENGYIGMFIWISLIIISYRRLFRLRRIAINDKDKFESPHFYRQVCEALLCSQTVFLLGGSFYSFVYADHIWIIFGLVMIVTKLMDKEVAEQDRKL
jgi:putative inorganic carbon (HCO3(-)) transporter